MRTAIDLQQLVEAAGDAMIVADASGAIVLWNPAAERLFGWSEAEALGQSLDLITPERLRHRHWEGYHKTMATGITKYGTDLLRVPALHKDGRPMSIAFTVALLSGAGAPNAILAIVRDDTVRFAEERALKKRVTELQAQVAGAGLTREGATSPVVEPAGG
jgi:PAS domain S-box-containing protein